MRLKASLALIALTSLGGCTSSGSGSGMGSTLGNLLRYGQATEPPIAQAGPAEAAYCPAVTVADGRAAFRSGPNQVSIANVARECVERPNGTVVVKVGVEGRALLGPGGRSARFDVPVVFAIRTIDRVLVSRAKRVSVSIPPGEAQASFFAIEGDMVVPAGVSEYGIEVGLGGGGAPARRRG